MNKTWRTVLRVLGALAVCFLLSWMFWFDQNIKEKKRIELARDSYYLGYRDGGIGFSEAVDERTCEVDMAYIEMKWQADSTMFELYLSLD